MIPTFAASWPEGAAWNRRELDGHHAPDAALADLRVWPPIDEGLAPGFGR